MTFKHEYIVPADHPNKEYAHKGEADQCEYEIGKHIARTFGWEKVEDHSHTFPSHDLMMYYHNPAMQLKIGS